jgi:hypothetical protein
MANKNELFNRISYSSVAASLAVMLALTSVAQAQFDGSLHLAAFAAGVWMVVSIAAIMISIRYDQIPEDTPPTARLRLVRKLIIYSMIALFVIIVMALLRHLGVSGWIIGVMFVGLLGFAKLLFEL